MTQSLDYKFLLKDNSVLPMIDNGPLAGTFNFQPGDIVCVEVVASAPDDMKITDKNFVVNNCTFISIPDNMSEFLSLFDKTSASSQVGNQGWSPVTLLEANDSDRKNKTKRYSRLNPQEFKVVTKAGQWKISGYLSVQLPPNGKAPTLDGLRNQLFYFDPESSAGTNPWGG